MAGKLAGRVACITGAASGIGRATARLFAREGAIVVATDIRAGPGADLVAELAREGASALFLEHDVADEAAWIAAIGAIAARHGRLDVLVNNAGLVRFATIEDLLFQDYKFQVDVMLDGTFLGCKTAIPHMTKGGGGSIINMASIGGMKGISAIPAYAAAKGGIIAMTRSIAVHCQEQGYRIRCNSIAPGGIVTPMTAQAVADLDANDPGLKQNRDLGMGEPSDVGNLVVFLASEESRHITGTNIVIDNAETIR
jgi:3(or 17)beta-hydroxysteroid dehydrogenase